MKCCPWLSSFIPNLAGGSRPYVSAEKDQVWIRRLRFRWIFQICKAVEWGGSVGAGWSSDDSQPVAPSRARVHMGAEFRLSSRDPGTFQGLPWVFIPVHRLCRFVDDQGQKEKRRRSSFNRI